jgi:hypothetical protein
MQPHAAEDLVDHAPVVVQGQPDQPQRIGGDRRDRGPVVGIVVGAEQLLSEERLPTRRAICGATDPSSASSLTASSAAECKGATQAVSLPGDRRAGGLLLPLKSVVDQAEISPERPLVVAGVRGRLPTPDG